MLRCRMSDLAAGWNRLRHIITEAAELSAGERDRFVALACADDAELRGQVDAMLGSSLEDEDYLERLASRAGLPFAHGDDAPPSGLERVGAYRLIRRIGEGGMGAVYLAQRADGEFEMRVAVKLLPAGHHTEVMRRRFAVERRVLARLAHSGISRLLDAGVTDGGMPFLVMEYAAGVPIDQYCDDNLLDIDARLDLFQEVCEAVEFAHSHEVVHRDLKPSNILVSADGRVKLLDFGIAKVADNASGMDATLTSGGQTPMTPGFASPEQIMGEPIGFGSDVYQLAVLLYLLLTGRLPSDAPESRAWADRTQMLARRRIVPASLAVGMGGQGDGRTAAAPEERARLRRTSIAALRSRLAGDVEAILLKGLRREPRRRYQSVAAMARELRRSREGRPVAASLEMLVRASELVPVETVPVPPRSSARVRSPAVVAEASVTVAVLPFTCSAGEDLAYLRLGLVSLLGDALDGGGVISAVEPSAILARLAADDPTIADAAAASRLAGRLGAGLYVLGEVRDTGRSVCISAALHDARRGGELRASAVAEGSSDKVFELVDSLAIDLLCAITPRRSADLVRAAADTTSLAALKLFMRGENALYAGAFFAAAEAFQNAVEADADFALGYYRLAMAAYWAHNLGLTRRFAAEAAARRDRLPPRERRLLAALQLYLDGHTAAAEQSYAALLTENPGDLEAAFLLGTLLFFHNALRGRSPAEARPCFERVLANQPDHILSLLYLSTIVARAGDLSALDVLTERLLAAYPDGGLPAYPIVACAQRAFAGDDGASQDRVLAELREAGSLAAITACQVTVLPGRDLSGARRVVELLVSAREDGAEIRAAGLVRRAHLELGGGRIAAARHDLEAARTLGSVEAAEFRDLFALAPFLPAPSENLETLKAGLAARMRVDPADAPPPVPHFAPHHGVHIHIQRFLLGLALARLGAYDDALEEARALEAATPLSDDVALRSFAATIRAEVAALRSGPEEALSVLEKHHLATSVERLLSSSFYAHGHARYYRAELLRSVGRIEEALAWYRTLGDLAVQDAIYLAPAQLRQAQIFVQQGDGVRAATHYRRFLQLWRDCDPVLRPMVEAAAEALARLEATASGRAPGMHRGIDLQSRN
jgi:serine/threonine protein kinase/TolB-like protein